MALSLQFHTKTTDPFKSLWNILTNKYSIEQAAKAYEWITLQDTSCIQVRKVAAVPIEHHVNWEASMPAQEAIITWSKMKYHVMFNSNHIAKDTRFLLIGFIRHVEYAIRQGMRFHFSKTTSLNIDNHIATLDDFCTFALKSMSAPPKHVFYT